MTKRLESAVPPADMWKGSCGTMANAWLMAMKIWAKTNHLAVEGLLLDGFFGDVGVTLTKLFQLAHGIEADGGVGPATRAKADEVLDFDFNEVAMALPGDTIFVGSDGEEILWVPTRADAVRVGRSV